MKTETPILALSSKQLRAAANLREKIDRYQTKLVFTLNLNGVRPPKASPTDPAPGRPGRPKKRQMSAAGRTRLSELAKLRWRRQRRLGKSTL